MEEATIVVIVGAGPSGLATAACLASKSIPYIILESEDCCASLWKKHSYDRLSLHLAKSFCSLPHKPHKYSTSIFMSKHDFCSYLDSYVKHFNIKPHYFRFVEVAFFDRNEKIWKVEAKNVLSGEREVYVAEFLVVATGENAQAFIPKIPGIGSFGGEMIHSSKYKNGRKYEGKSVLVVGSGNSGMEISHDLSDFRAKPSIVVRSPFHVLSKQMVYVGMLMLIFIKMKYVDSLISLPAKFFYGDLHKYGIQRPKIGPFLLKATSGKTPVIDGGSIKKIRSKKIKVVSTIKNINGNNVEFEDGTQDKFDAIILATGYKSVATIWFKDYEYVFNSEGMPKNEYPNHWKGENRVYCIGMSGRGIAGISSDAILVTDDIHKILDASKKATGAMSSLKLK
ncbi:Pyridine nucleotide-disulfide oxidoreductase, class-II [Trema orientale]|uniref:Flavin-containing monooxygenase n=1 Tax=Trema orientale TaxID=63057 RepID=A0A2P5E8Z6_TREOI|nr:Pyridine nucleotide-disulfide oxidoreductase, class-II [Trema orientale]